MSHVELGIKAVVTTARGLMLPHSKDDLPNYLYLPVDDTEHQSISKYFPTVFDFMEKNRLRTNVLVHCYSGISRSAAFIIAYLMRKYKYSVNQSLLMIKQRKRRVMLIIDRSNQISRLSNNSKSIRQNYNNKA